ncbi:MAG: hypothetical protein Q6L50_05725 [Gloeomargarita sp. GMQP_bins_120]
MNGWFVVTAVVGVAMAQGQVAALLRSLPRPPGSRSVNLVRLGQALGRQSLVYHVSLQPEQALQFLQETLGQQGYRERSINTLSGPWGFYAVFDLPPTTPLVTSTPGQTVILVYRGTVTTPGNLLIQAWLVRE